MPSQVDVDYDRLPIGGIDGLDGEVVEVITDIAFLLPSGLVEILAKLSLLIKEPDTDQRHSQIAG